MATETPTTTSTALYQLVQAKLGCDPVQFIRERRSQTPPMPYTRIRDEIIKLTDVYLTHEAPRRWLRAADAAAAHAA